MIILHTVTSHHDCVSALLSQGGRFKRDRVDNKDTLTETHKSEKPAVIYLLIRKPFYHIAAFTTQERSS